MKSVSVVGSVGLLMVGLAIGRSAMPGPPKPVEDPVPPEPRAFRAARPDTESGEEALAGTIRRIIEGVVTDPELPPARESELVEELVVVLRDHGLGSPDRRAEAARRAVASIAEAAARFAGDHAGPDELRRRAIRQQSAELLRALLRDAGHLAARPSGFGPRPAGYRKLIWNELTDIDYTEGDPLPERVLALDGEQVAMAGFLVDLGYEGEVLLVRSVWSCCFGRPPEVHEAVVVAVEGQAEDAWFDEVVRVAGTLEVGEDWDGDFLSSVYRLRAAQVDTLEP